MIMKVSDQTISALSEIVTGNGNLSPYRSGPDLVCFFNQFCNLPDTYGRGFPSRWMYAEEKLQELNNSGKFADALLAAIDPRDFLNTDFKCETAADHLNLFLEYDGYEVRQDGVRWNVTTIEGGIVGMSNPFDGSEDLVHQQIPLQISKSKKRLESGDHAGSITSSRCLLEAVLLALEQVHDSNPPQYDGNLLKLYRRVQRHLNLVPGQKGLADCLRQILSGMASIVHGLSTFRNCMGDSHVVRYRAHKHHALLAINCAQTMSQFLLDTNEYQKRP